jgi:hypothetical protein
MSVPTCSEGVPHMSKPANIKVYLMVDNGELGTSPDNYGYRIYHDGDLVDEVWGFHDVEDAMINIGHHYKIAEFMTSKQNKLSVEWKVLS